MRFVGKSVRIFQRPVPIGRHRGMPTGQRHCARSKSFPTACRSASGRAFSRSRTGSLPVAASSQKAPVVRGRSQPELDFDGTRLVPNMGVYSPGRLNRPPVITVGSPKRMTGVQIRNPSFPDARNNSSCARRRLSARVAPAASSRYPLAPARRHRPPSRGGATKVRTPVMAAARRMP